MKFKKLTAVLLSAAALAAMPVSPVMRDLWQQPAVTAEAATMPTNYYKYTTGGICYELDTKNKEAYIYSYTGSPTNLVIRATVSYANGPYKIVGIRDNAFNGCSTLTTVDLSVASNLRSIGHSAFRYSSVRNVFINSSVSVGQYAFANTGNLQSVTLQAYGQRVTVQPYAFAQSAVQNFYGYAPEIDLQSNAFWQCMSLNYVRFNSNVQKLSFGDSLFFKLSNLNTIRIEGTNTKLTLAPYTFCNCGITSLTLPNTVTTIPSFCFSGCQLTSFTMPDSVTTISDNAFSSATLPATLKISKAVSSIADSAFAYTYGVKAYTLDSSNTKYKTVDGLLLNKSGNRLLAYPQAKTNSSYTIDARYIPDGVLHNNTSLVTLKLTNFIQTYSYYKAYFPGLDNLKYLTIASSEYNQSAGAILKQYETLLKSPKLCRLNGNDLVRKLPSGEPVFGAKISDEMTANFEKYEYYPFMQDYVDKMASFIVARVTTSSMTPIQKALHIRSWIMGRVQYDYDSKKDKKNHVDASVFLHQKSDGKYYTVCDGYARCYEILMNKAGIQTYYVVDYKYNIEEEEGHCWNLIKLNNKWYHVDVTWDDGKTGDDRYDNFLCPDAQFDNDGHGTYNWQALGNAGIRKGSGYAVMDNRKLGDVNGDGKFNSADVTKIRSYFGTTNNTYLARCDLNFDGKVDSTDESLLSSYITTYCKQYTTPRIWRFATYEK